MTAPFALLDTNIVSYIFRRDSRAAPFIEYLKDHTPCIAAQTVAELHFGARRRRWGNVRYDELRRTIDRLVVLSIDKETAELWAELALQAQALGRAMAAADLWALATAERWDVPLLTHDKGFSWYGGPIEVIDS
jgi:predicted nucleic acid-binding protein